jgi:hypothetical protein
MLGFLIGFPGKHHTAQISLQNAMFPIDDVALKFFKARLNGVVSFGF